jgi:hypothetical protein
VVLIIIGIIVIALAPIWKWAIGPQLLKLPDDIDTTSIYEGVLSLSVDPNSLALLPPELEVKVPLTITRTDVSQPDLSTGSVAVVKENVSAVGPGGKEFITWEKFYAMDRKTAENVPGNNSDMDREGYFLLYGFGVKQESYPIWDDDTMKTTDSEFVKEETRDGFDNADVPVYVFEVGGKDKMVEPPLGLPDKISGAQIKALINNRALPFNDTEMYKIDFLKDTQATLVVEPRTGIIVDIPSYDETYYVDAGALGMGEIKLANLLYRQTGENVREQIDDAASFFGLLDMVQIWIPVILLVVGLIILIIGIALFARKPKA